jgi:hypothetical protein
VTDKQLAKDLTEFIRQRMPWPFSDVDRNDQEARQTAAAIAAAPLASMLEEFRQLEAVGRKKGK